MANLRIAAVASALLLTLCACGDGDAKTEDAKAGENLSAGTEPDPSPTADPDDVAQEYFDLLGTFDPQDGEKAVALAAPGSNAFAYATYLSASLQAYLDSGDDPTEYAKEVKSIDGGFSICRSDDECTDFTKIQTLDGKIASFDSDDASIEGDVILGGKAKPLGDGTVRMIAAYDTGPSVVIAFEVKTGPTALGLSYVQDYRSPDGRQSKDTQNVHPGNLAANSVANTVVTFKGAKLGGVVTFRAYPEGDSTELTATFKTAS